MCPPKKLSKTFQKSIDPIKVQILQNQDEIGWVGDLYFTNLDFHDKNTTITTCETIVPLSLCSKMRLPHRHPQILKTPFSYIPVGLAWFFLGRNFSYTSNFSQMDMKTSFACWRKIRTHTTVPYCCSIPRLAVHNQTFSVFCTDSGGQSC